MAHLGMPAKKILLIAVLLLAAGIAVSYVLLPHPDEIAEIKTILPASSPGAEGEATPAVELATLKARYNAEKKSGTLALETVQAYANALMAAGDQATAIAIWEAYANTLPDNAPQASAAWQELANLYQMVGDRKQTLRVLEKLVKLEPTEARLKALSDQYNSLNMYAEQVGVLQQLVTLTGHKNPDYLLGLVDVALLAEDEGAAREAMTAYIESYGAEAKAVRIEQYIRLLAAAGEKEQATNAAIALMDGHADKDLQARIADILLYEAGSGYTIRYIETLSAGAEIPAGLTSTYARALVQQGDFDKALPVLQTLQSQGGEFREWYFLALARAAKTDKASREALAQHVRDSFAAGGLSQQQQLDRVYALLNSGQKSLALDYSERALAAAEGEDKTAWQTLHRELTVKPVVARAVKQPKILTLDERIANASTGKADDKTIRSTAFDALAAGQKWDAITLFSMLAAKNGAASTDTAQLLYLWGTRISGDELQWLVARAAASEGEDRAGWISIIADHAPAEDIAELGNAYPHWLDYPAFERRYAASLLQLGDHAALSRYLADQVGRAQTAKRYLRVAEQAAGLMDMGTAEAALFAASEKEPDNREAWIRLTALYFAQARYEEARDTLIHAMTIPFEPSIRPYDAARSALMMNFYAGQMMRHDGKPRQAEAYFAEAVNSSDGQMYADRDLQMKLLVSQMMIGQHELASEGFETLLQYNPGDAGLLADYVSALLDIKDYERAEEVVARHGGNVVFDHPEVVDDTESFLIPAQHGETPLARSFADGSEITLQYSRPLPAGKALIDPNLLPLWVAYTTTSYDTALIAAAPGYRLEAAATSEGLQIFAAPKASVTAGEMQAGQALRLQLLYARLELETGGIRQSLDRLQSLTPQFAGHSTFLGYQASAEYYADNLQRGLQLVKEAHRAEPGNEDIAYLKRNIERFHAEHLKADVEHQKIGKHHLTIGTAQARRQLPGGYEATATVQDAHVNSSFLQRADGRINTVESNRWRAAVSLAKAMDDSSLATATIYSNRDTVGAGLSYQWVNALGTSSVYGEYRRPYWLYVEAMVEDATRDRLGAWHLWRPTPRWSVRADAGYNRYNIAGKSNIGNTGQLQATVLHTLFEKQPFVALAYGFDGEYTIDAVDRGLYLGVPYRLLPLRSHEVHSLSAIFYHDFTRDTNGELSFGWAADRLGKHGPSAEARMNHYLTEDIELQLRARYGLEIQKSDNNALSMGGYVRWIW